MDVRGLCAVAWGVFDSNISRPDSILISFSCDRLLPCVICPMEKFARLVAMIYILELLINDLHDQCLLPAPTLMFWRRIRSLANSPPRRKVVPKEHGIRMNHAHAHCRHVSC